MCQLVLHARGPGQRWGGGAVLALLGWRWGWASDTLACAACSRSRAKMGGGLWCSLCLALLAGLGLLGLRWCQAADHQKGHYVPYYLDIVSNCHEIYDLGIICRFSTLKR
jgi:hypothetical protein